MVIILVIRNHLTDLSFMLDINLLDLTEFSQSSERRKGEENKNGRPKRGERKRRGRDRRKGKGLGGDTLR